MRHCLNCDGAIGEPGKAYGYVGKWCHCPIHPDRLYQNPAKKAEDAYQQIIRTQELNRKLKELGVSIDTKNLHQCDDFGCCHPDMNSLQKENIILKEEIERLKQELMKK